MGLQLDDTSTALQPKLSWRGLMALNNARRLLTFGHVGSTKSVAEHELSGLPMQPARFLGITRVHSSAAPRIALRAYVPLDMLS